jgi:hypothetical protein
VTWLRFLVAHAVRGFVYDVVIWPTIWLLEAAQGKPRWLGWLILSPCVVLLPIGYALSRLVGPPDR